MAKYVQLHLKVFVIIKILKYPPKIHSHTLHTSCDTIKIRFVETLLITK